MNKNEFIYILVPEETLEVHDYYEALTEENNRHGKCVENFCRKINLNIDSDKFGITNYNGYKWCMMLAVLGYLSIHEDELNTIVYIPPVVTVHQYKNMKELKLNFKKKRNSLYMYSYQVEDNKLVENRLNEFQEEDSVEVLYEELKYKRERGMKDVSRIKNI